MLSFSNFGSVECEQSAKVRRAVELARQRDPDLCIDGEMQADTAVSEAIQARSFSFCELRGRANVLIFPDLASGNIASKLITRLGTAEAIGPLTLGFDKPINVLHPSCDVEDVVNAAVITVIECLDGTL
jgi:malate dehydrogenase (oxaloacetate-decarboxylating)(NADP+)